MKYLKPYRMFESTLSKNDLVDKIKYLSHYLETYVRDVNKFTTSNLNLSFSYDTVLNINEIFDVANKLDYNSSDGFITAVAQQFIIWSEYFTERKQHGDRFKQSLQSFEFDENYLNYTDDFKQANKWELYKQEYNHMLYGYVGQTIKHLISGTIWDIPEKKEFVDEDKEFILDCLHSEYEDVTTEYIKKASEMIDVSKTVRLPGWRNHSKGYIIRIPVFGDRWSHIKIDYNSDLFRLLDSYFGGVFILSGSCREYYKFYLPFYN